jgi:hypothetical protein
MKPKEVLLSASSLLRPSPVMSTPSRNTFPDVARSMPDKQWSSVVFPDPDGPMIAVTEASSKATETPSSTRLFPPNLFDKSTVFSKG